MVQIIFGYLNFITVWFFNDNQCLIKGNTHVPRRVFCQLFTHYKKGFWDGLCFRFWLRWSLIILRDTQNNCKYTSGNLCQCAYKYFKNNKNKHTFFCTYILYHHTNNITFFQIHMCFHATQSFFHTCQSLCVSSVWLSSTPAGWCRWWVISIIHRHQTLTLHLTKIRTSRLTRLWPKLVKYTRNCKYTSSSKSHIILYCRF